MVAPKPGEAQAMHLLDKAGKFSVDGTTKEVRMDDFDAVVLPGGVADPDQLRLDEPAVTFVKAMVDAGKPVAAICHGPWTVIEADVVRGRRLTSWPSVRSDITNAGDHRVDEEVVVCTSGPNALVTSRKPDDLKAFCHALTAAFAAARPSR
jgi:protease I